MRSVNLSIKVRPWSVENNFGSAKYIFPDPIRKQFGALESRPIQKLRLVVTSLLVSRFTGVDETRCSRSCRSQFLLASLLLISSLLLTAEHQTIGCQIVTVAVQVVLLGFSD
jgi:hypothetical protein